MTSHYLPYRPCVLQHTPEALFSLLCHMDDKKLNEVMRELIELDVFAKSELDALNLVSMLRGCRWPTGLYNELYWTLSQNIASRSYVGINEDQAKVLLVLACLLLWTEGQLGELAVPQASTVGGVVLLCTTVINSPMATMVAIELLESERYRPIHREPETVAMIELCIGLLIASLVVVPVGNMLDLGSFPRPWTWECDTHSIDHWRRAYAKIIPRSS